MNAELIELIFIFLANFEFVKETKKDCKRMMQLFRKRCIRGKKLG